MKKYFLFLIVLIIFGKISLSQNRASCILGDSIRLNLNNYRGNASWQESIDNQNWTDISGSSAQLRIVPDTVTKWVRAKIEEVNCPMFYDLPFMISSIDTAAIGFNRNNLSVEQLQVEFVSDDGNGLYIFNLNGNEFPLNVGDWLSGFADQQNMKQIDALIIQDGFARVYTSSSAVSVYDIPLNFGMPSSGKVMGRVLTENGEIVIAAKVKIGMDSTYTDFNGVFIIDNASIFEKMGYVTVSKFGYFTGSRTFIPKPEGNEVEIRLLERNLVGNFISSAGANLNVENIELQFPTNAIMLNGYPYNGNVNVFMNYINPESNQFLQEMPGNLIGNQNGNIRGLTSFGMIGIEMQNDFGQLLQIALDHEVTAKFPINIDMMSQATDTIDLWSFNETQGIWLDEGEAVKVGSSYVAHLPHFSFWNLDQAWEAVFLNGTITFENGNPVSGYSIQLSNPNTGSASDITNSSGQFSGLVPSNMEFNISLDYLCENGLVVNILNNSILGPFNNDTIIFIQNMTLPNNIYCVFGSIHNCESIPINNGYVISGSQVTYLNQGNFIFNTCSSIDSFRIVKLNPLEFNSWQIINLSELENNLGILTLCGGDTLVSTDTVLDIDGNVYNTVLIGDQWWMAENLKVTHYSNGIVIPNLIDGLAWLNATSGAMCDYDNIFSNTDIHGKIYNGYTATNSNNVCPIGWHTPSKTEWEELISFAGGFALAGGNLKSLEYWNQPNVGAENTFGFSAIPGGTRYQDIQSQVVFGLINELAMYWTSTIEFGGIYAARMFYDVNSTNNFYNPYYAYSGASIRCIKD
jgi:uncharacterized protein (TIGR02145 family)